jgi:hypothetical protein
MRHSGRSRVRPWAEAVTGRARRTDRRHKSALYWASASHKIQTQWTGACARPGWVRRSGSVLRDRDLDEGVEEWPVGIKERPMVAEGPRLMIFMSDLPFQELYLKWTRSQFGLDPPG